MSEPLDSLVAGWQRHFQAADATIQWLGVSECLQLELEHNVWLAGELDARGRNASGELFFGEWKTANPRERKTWKQVWRMNPQSLSYGVLAAAHWPEMQRFTVRKAFKETYPSYDHAWFRYSAAELEHWRTQLLWIAAQVRHIREGDANWSRCFKYGPNYVCPFFEVACNKLEWEGVQAGWGVGGDATWSFTQQRAEIRKQHPNAIVLSPTTVADWLDCHEMYRRKYVQLVTPTKNSSLILGGEFHNEIAKLYRGMVK